MHMAHYLFVECMHAGHILESARATVYALQRGKEIEGLLVSSASADDEWGQQFIEHIHMAHYLVSSASADDEWGQQFIEHW